MDVREKLVEVLKKCGVCNIYAVVQLANALADNGVTVQQRGEWEEIEDDWSMETIYKCSACKEEFVTIDGTPADNLWNYCPHCGAKMMPQPPKGE